MQCLRANWGDRIKERRRIEDSKKQGKKKPVTDQEGTCSARDQSCADGQCKWIQISEKIRKTFLEDYQRECISFHLQHALVVLLYSKIEDQM